jgi:carbonic anhydrase
MDLISEPPDIDIKKKGAHTLVLACIDPRFTELLAHFLINEKDVHNDYDLVALAGASLGANQNEMKSWRKMLYDHIDIAIKLHNIKSVWVFDHLDCGMYKEVMGTKTDLDPAPHKKQLVKLKKKLAKSYPELSFKGYIMDTDGAIYRVVH